MTNCKDPDSGTKTNLHKRLDNKQLCTSGDDNDNDNDKENLYNNNIIIIQLVGDGDPQRFFEWLSLFIPNSAAIYSKIILFLLQNKICSSSSIHNTFQSTVAQQNVFVYLNKLLGYNIIRELKPDEIIEQANSLKAHRLASRPKRTPRGINGIQFYTLTDQAKRFFSSWTQWQWEITAQDREEIQLYKQRLEKLLTEISRQQNKRKNQQKERTRRNKEQQRQEAAARERKRELLSRAKELAAPYLEAGRELLKEQDHERYRNIYVFMRHVFMYASALQLSPWEILEKHLPPDMVRAIRDMNVEAIVGFYTDREATRRLTRTSQALQHALNSILTAGEDAVI